MWGTFGKSTFVQEQLLNYWRNFCCLLNYRRNYVRNYWEHLMPRILLSPGSEGSGRGHHIIRLHPRWFWKPSRPEMGWLWLILTSLALDLDQWTLILKLPGLGSDMILMILQMLGLGFCWFDIISLVSGLELGAVFRWFWCSRASDMKRRCCFLLVAGLLKRISIDLESLYVSSPSKACHGPWAT